MSIPIPILETPRLRLRPLCVGDGRRIQALFPHPEIVEYMAAAIPWPYPADGAARFLEITLPKMESGRQYDWAITLKEAGDGLLVGIISLYPHGDDSRGFWIGQDYQRRGLMTEAVAAVNDFAFDVLGMPHLTLNNAEPNLGSHRLKEAWGAEIIETNDAVAYVGGRFRQVRWRLTREAWKAAQSAGGDAGGVETPGRESPFG